MTLSAILVLASIAFILFCISFLLFKIFKIKWVFLNQYLRYSFLQISDMKHSARSFDIKIAGCTEKSCHRALVGHSQYCTRYPFGLMELSDFAISSLKENNFGFAACWFLLIASLGNSRVCKIGRHPKNPGQGWG